MVKICVGSRNPAKLRGAEKVFMRFFGAVEVKGYGVEGIPKQPIGLKSIIEFAKHRAEKVREIDATCDFYLGVEAGLIDVEDLGYFDLHVACLIDRSGRISYGFSPAFSIPRKFVELIVSGVYRELEEVVDAHYGTVGVGDKGGFISLLTRGNIVREDLVYYSIAMALTPILNSEIYLV